jgi:hypothetical protein
MPGWSSHKRRLVEESFYAFLNCCFINSKDSADQICLGEGLYDGQRRFITTVFDSLEADIHKVFVLKSRQLGLSTIARALSIFMLGVHSGLKGAIVFDSDQNKNESRAEIEVMINDLPKNLKFPAVTGNNRTGLTLANDSKVLFMSAGTRKSKSSGTLGRSVGLSLAHLSELCSYDNDEGLIAFENSLSDAHPDRLYIYESTARGHNTWYKIWKRARADPAHCACVFLGWWSKASQVIARTDRDFELYGIDPPTTAEVTKISKVLELYGHQITVEQLAWIRRKMDPQASQLADDTDTEEDDPNLIQEQPWTEDESFQLSGSRFFPNVSLLDQTTRFVSSKYKAYMCIAGQEFFDMRIFASENYRTTDLKVWEEPDPKGCYILSCDPAFGENENNDRSSIQVGRCYADGIDQVAEYASPLIDTRQLAWVIASLLGWYGYGNTDCRYILELNGPGIAVFNELRSLKNQIDSKYQAQQYEERGLQDIFRNIRTYIYTRPDSMGVGTNFHFKTNSSLKVTIMEQLRSSVMGGLLHVRSSSAIREMQSIARDGDKISAPSSGRDDCVLALALLVYYWDTGVRRTLIQQKKSRASEAARAVLSLTDQVKLFGQNTLDTFFAQKRVVRAREDRMARRAAWRYR